MTADFLSLGMTANFWLFCDCAGSSHVRVGRPALQPVGRPAVQTYRRRVKRRETAPMLAIPIHCVMPRYKAAYGIRTQGPTTSG